MSANPSFDTSGDSLDDFTFTFESYLDASSRIEPDSASSNESIHSCDRESASLTESIFEYYKENGRTYHSYRAGSYLYPNDSMEQERLDNQHELLKILLDGRNYLAPLSHDDPPRKILDLATGTGRWAIEMGDEFPQASVTGTDLSPIQPVIVPPKVKFWIDDGNEEWPNGRDWYNLDYIHTRVTVGCWSDMRSVIRTAFERLRPGGWLESQEPYADDIYCDDGPVPENHALRKWVADLASVSAEADRPLGVAAELKQYYLDAGFVDVHEKIYKIPINGWPRVPELKRIGEMWHRNLEDGMAGFSYALFHRVKGMTKEQIEVRLVEVRKDLADQKVHAYMKFGVVWGRKPGRPSDASSFVSTPSISQDQAMTGCS